MSNFALAFTLAASVMTGSPTARTALGAESSVLIQGWRAADLGRDAPSQELGDDPVVGRLVCPPVSRINLASSQSDPLLISAAESVRESGVFKWVYTLRTGIYWWGGDEVRSSDLKRFLAANLEKIIQRRGNGKWSIPAYEIQLDGPYRVLVTWSAEPKYGPFVLNGVPFWRSQRPKQADSHSKMKSTAVAYECAGLYIPQKSGDVLTLKPSAGYSRQARPDLVLTSQTSNPTGHRWVRFSTADRFPGNPWKRSADEEAECAHKLDLPELTMIVWNSKRSPVSNPKMRQTLTSLTPRGALLRSAAASLGELLSGPLPRSHPGYDPSILVRPFDLKEASRQLDELGYSRREPYLPRVDKHGNPLELVLGTSVESSGLAEKVLSDSLAAVGINVNFKKVAKATPQLDGYLVGVRLDWPGGDLRSLIGGLGQGTEGWYVEDPDLDRLLEGYALSLTQAVPDFGLLRKVHRRLFDLEPFTVLLQHKTCIDMGRGLTPRQAHLKSSDPDWFRWLIL